MARPPSRKQPGLPFIERLLHARQVVIEGSGHAVILDNPQAFNRILLEFLSEW